MTRSIIAVRPPRSMPIAFASSRGMASSVTPSAILNHPSPRDSVASGGLTELGLLRKAETESMAALLDWVRPPDRQRPFRTVDASQSPRARSPACADVQVGGVALGRVDVTEART